MDCGENISNSVLTYFEPGINEIEINFSGVQIREQGNDGPYTLKNVSLFDTHGLTGKLLNEYQTDTYSIEDFQNPPISLKDIDQDYGVDTNNDGLYNYLRLVLDVNVSTASIFYFSASLYNTNSTNRSHVVSIVNQVNLSEGIQNVNLDFAGTTIRQNEIDGPYNLSYLTIYNENWYILIYEEDTYTTQAYNYKDFQEYVEPETSVYISPKQKQVEINQNFSIDVDVTALDLVYSTEFDLFFNASVLQAINVTAGDFLKKNETTTYPVNITTDNNIGKISLNSNWYGIDFAKTGTGTLATIIFNSTSSGETILDLENVTLLDELLDPLSVISQDGNVNVVAMITQEFLLYSGWNLITVPVENSWWASTMSENITGCVMVSRFDAVNQTYDSYIVGGPPQFDFLIENGYGYFILVDESSVFSTLGNRISSVSVPLYIGWNMIGWFQSYDTMASLLAENISGCSMVSWFNASSQSFETYIVGGPPQFDFEVSPGMGVFVLVDEESTWHGEG